MKKLLLFLSITLLLEVSPAVALPTLYVNGEEVDPVTVPGWLGPDLTFSFSYGEQVWTLLSETTPWENLNYLGVYDDIGTGSSQTEIFSGTDSPFASVTTSFLPGKALGFYLLNDLYNNNGEFDPNSDDTYLFSERGLSQPSYTQYYQWFVLYDVSSFGEADYLFNTHTEDWMYTGNFDYLLFVDDDHTRPNLDYNDMIVGISHPVPEPSTVLLLGAGLIGLAFLGRMRSKGKQTR